VLISAVSTEPIGLASVGVVKTKVRDTEALRR
jgi:hypothetical protein